MKILEYHSLKNLNTFGIDASAKYFAEFSSIQDIEELLSNPKFLNTKKLIEKLGPELSSNANKKIADLFLQNFGDVKMESKLKDGMIQGTTTMNIKGAHTNSFEFIFNLMDAINNIMEKEKAEDEKKIN